MSNQRIDRSTSRQWSGRPGLALCGLVWLLACSSDSNLLGPPIVDPPGHTESPFVVSDPVVGSAPAYVSLPTGGIPGATGTRIRNLRMQTEITVPVLGGGFDPVAVEAEAGDTLVIVAKAGDFLNFVTRVPATAPPIVVRTEPTAGRRDVPLNARIIIVFSEPIDSTTLTGMTVRLRRGLTTVAGEVHFVDDEHLTAEFAPDAPLSPNSEYELVVTEGIEDLDGESLQEPVSVEFTTSTAAALRLVFTSQPSDATQDVAISPVVEVTVQDAAGKTVLGFADVITIGLGQNPGGGGLAGTTTVSAVGGVATFADVRVSSAGLGYTLTASASGFTDVSSSAFRVWANPGAFAGVYERTTPHGQPGYHSRILLGADGRFGLEYESPQWGSLVYAGGYGLAGSSITFAFDGWDTVGPWDASAAVLGDSLYVSLFNTVMQLADFEEGVYVRSTGAPLPGSVRITVSVSGESPDTALVVTLDGGVSAHVSAGTSPLLLPAVPGARSLLLSGIASTCAVVGPNPVNVIVTPGGTADVDFQVSCTGGSRTTGVDLVVTTTGADLAVDHYVRFYRNGDECFDIFDCPYLFADRVPANGTVELDLPAAQYTVTWSTSPNCGGYASGAQVTVSPGQVTTVPMNFSCQALSALIVNVLWSGIDFPLFIIISASYPGATTLTSGYASFRVLEGTRSVQLSRLPDNCTVQGPNPVSVEVVSGDTTNVTIPVDCVENPTLRISVVTTGPNAPEYYVVTMEDDSGWGSYVSTTVFSSGNVLPIRLPVGSPRVTLEQLPPNCTVTSPNGVVVPMPLGSITDLAFAVACS